MKYPFTLYFWFKFTVCGIASMFAETPDAADTLTTVSLLSLMCMGLMYLVESDRRTW